MPEIKLYEYKLNNITLKKERNFKQSRTIMLYRLLSGPRNTRRPFLSLFIVITVSESSAL